MVLRCEYSTVCESGYVRFCDKMHRGNLESHPHVNIVSAANSQLAGKLCLRDRAGPLDTAIYQYMPRMASEKDGTGSMLAVTNGGDAFWHYKEPGLWYDEATRATYIGVNKPFADVVELFLKNKGFFPVVEVRAPSQPVAAWAAKGGKGRGPILLYDPGRRVESCNALCATQPSQTSGAKRVKSE